LNKVHVKTMVRENRAVVFTLLNLCLSVINLKKRTGKYDLRAVNVLTGVTIFIFSFLWFSFPAEYARIANQDLTLFRLTSDYLLTCLKQPGGFLEYLGSFLGQFLRFRFPGALLLAGIVTSVYYVANLMVSGISNRKELFLTGALTSVLFVGMHNYYPHQIDHSMGFILAILLASLTPGSGTRRWIFLAFAVPVVYLALGGYVWIYCGLVLAEDLVRTRKPELKLSLLTTLYPALVITGGASFLFLDPPWELAVTRLPFGKEYGASPWPAIFVIWIFLFVLIAGLPDPWKKVNAAWRRLAITLLCLAALGTVLHLSYNRRNAEIFHIEKLAINEDWNGLLQYTGQHPSTNLFGTFYTNLALVMTGHLCNDLFNYPQVFGRRGLCFEWDAKGELLRRGSDFFWTVFFVNEAHHWAFESMIIDGVTRRNITRLIEAELVRGNTMIAQKYIDLLGKSLFNRKLADHYRPFLHSREAIENDPELGPRLRFHLGNDFFSEGVDLEKNLKMLLASNPSNKPAADYLMALLLLEKKVDQISELLPAYADLSQGKLPVLLDEALMVYKITHKEDRLEDLKVSSSTLRRFDEYSSILQRYREPADAARMLYPSFRQSFWFYLNFSSLTKGR
jgi:hypothetical protein